MSTAAGAPFRPSISMLGWALNEEQNLDDYVERAAAFLGAISEDFELVLIDDGSTDRTWEMACRLARSRPWIRLLRNDGNRGSGYCYRRAIGAVTKDYFFVQTVDWAYDISRLAGSMDLLRDFDVLQGVRAGTASARGIAHRSDNLMKGVISVVNYRLIRTLFRLPLGDYQNVTVCPVRLLRDVRLEADSSFANPEVLLKLWWQGAAFKEVPVPFRPRTRGKATGTRWRSILRSMTEIVRYWFGWIVLRRRQHFGAGTVSALPSARA